MAGFLNGYKDGFDAGYSAGLAGKSANCVHSHGLLKMAAQALKPQSYTETFMSGWSEGYRKGADKRQG